MSSKCSICGGYAKTTYITRRLPAVDAATGEPYPIAPVPPIRFCQGHADTAIPVEIDPNLPEDSK